VVLVDTSVWIEVFRKPPRIQLESLVDFDEIVTCLPVIHEVLQGFDAEPAFLRAREAMQAWPIVESPLSPDVWLQAHCQTPPSVPSDSDRTPRDPIGRDVGEARLRERRSEQAQRSEPRERSGPTKRPARERVGESEGRSPSE